MNGLEELHMWILLIFVIYLFNYDKYLTWSTFYVPGIVIALCVLTQIFTTTVFDTYFSHHRLAGKETEAWKD